MCFSNDGTNWTAWEPYATSKSWTLTSGDGTKTVYVKFKDSAGNTSVYSDNIILDTTPPTGSIVINGDNMYTNSIYVILTLSASDANGVSQMCFSDNGITWTDWEPYATSKPWTLPSGDGTKTVYVRFKDSAGNVSTYSDTIILDTTPPTAPAGLYTDPITSPDNYSSNVTPQVGWTIDATDNGSGVLKYQLRTDTNSNWVDFVNGSDVPAGYIVSRSSPNLIYIRALDAAGNPSAESMIEYYCDNTPPTDLSVTIEENENLDYQYVTGSTIYYNTSVCGSFWVRVSASDPESGLLKVVFPL
jgi:hypothetical protein